MQTAVIDLSRQAPDSVPTPTVVINKNLQAPSNLATLSLDSTIKAIWMAPTDSKVAWQVFSVWDQRNMLVASKVLGKTATAADGNGLQTGATYIVKVQSMDASGALSNPVTATATTDAQSPMKNAAFFENFDDTAPGDLNGNYFDVRTFDRPNHPIDPAVDFDKRQVFVNERHFHTQVIGGEDSAGIFLRPRVPFDFTNRTGTIQFEVDFPAILRVPGKWWEVDVSQDPISNEEQLGDTSSGNFRNSVVFGFFNQDTDLFAASSPQRAVKSVNLPIIKVNIGGIITEFKGTEPVYTPTNVRLPVVLKLSQTSAEMFVNGKSRLKATGFRLPFTRGNIQFFHRANYGTKVIPAPFNPPTQTVQLLHWETIQYDGPDGSFSPVMKTYIQPDCKAVVTYGSYANRIDSCGRMLPLNGGSVTISIPDNLSQAKTVRCIFNRTTTSGHGTITINGHTTSIPMTSHPVPFDQVVDHSLELEALDIPVSWLKQGANTVQFHFSDSGARFTQTELEVSFNQPRVIGNPPVMPMPMISATATTFRVERLTTDPMQLTGTTYLYSSGSADPVKYSAAVITTKTPWLKIISPTKGTIHSSALGAGVTPLKFRVDFSDYTTPSRLNFDGDIGIIKVTGGNMPQYVGVLRAYYGRTSYYGIIPATAFPLTVQFDKAAIPDYNAHNSTANVGGQGPLYTLANRSADAYTFYLVIDDQRKRICWK
ncbi:MAG TPA: hypothetical protein VFV38_38525 [Ktedonobacteraceae bacterium]|nr:hypothetical protein [Ktedonobacteraceae bacterium]